MAQITLQGQHSVVYNMSQMMGGVDIFVRRSYKQRSQLAIK